MENVNDPIVKAELYTIINGNLTLCDTMNENLGGFWSKQEEWICFIIIFNFLLFGLYLQHYAITYLYAGG